MAHGAMVDSYVRELMAGMFGDDLAVEGGVYGTPLETGVAVRVRGSGAGLRVTATAVVLAGVELDSRALQLVNRLNAGLVYGRIFADGSDIVVEHSVLGATVDGDSLDNAISFVDWVVRTHGPDLAHELGGYSVAHPQPHLPGIEDGPIDLSLPQGRGGSRDLHAIGAAGPAGYL